MLKHGVLRAKRCDLYASRNCFRMIATLNNNCFDRANWRTVDRFAGGAGIDRANRHTPSHTHTPPTIGGRFFELSISYHRGWWAGGQVTGGQVVGGQAIGGEVAGGPAPTPQLSPSPSSPPSLPIPPHHPQAIFASNRVGGCRGRGERGRSRKSLKK